MATKNCQYDPKTQYKEFMAWHEGYRAAMWEVIDHANN